MEVSHLLLWCSSSKSRLGFRKIDLALDSVIFDLPVASSTTGYASFVTRYGFCYHIKLKHGLLYESNAYFRIIFFHLKALNLSLIDISKRLTGNASLRITLTKVDILTSLGNGQVKNSCKCQYPQLQIPKAYL